MTTMMSLMQTARPRTDAGPTSTFIEVCKALYGDYVDPEVVWNDVVKVSPDQADLNARTRRAPRSRKRTATENIALATNAAGVAAAPAAIYSAVRSARRNEGGIPREIGRAIGAKRPGSRIGRLVRTIDAKAGRKGRALALGAAIGGPALQVANATGDSISAVHFAKPKERREVGKRRNPVDVRPQVAGLRRVWRGSLMPAGGAQPVRQAPKKVAKADDTVDVTFAGEFSKFDDAKRQAFGWASVVKVNGQPVVDQQGDYIDMDDLETAAYQYVHKSRVGGDMHRRNGDVPHKVSDMIESFVLTDEKARALKVPDDVPRGWWVGYQIHDEDTWQEVRKKGRTGFSIHGKGIRKDHSLDELMGY